MPSKKPALLPQEAIKHLEAIYHWQEFTQGQVDALRIALFEVFQHLQSDAALRSRVESHLENRLRIMCEKKESPAAIDGFQSALRDLVAGFHSGNKGDTVN